MLLPRTVFFVQSSTHYLGFLSEGLTPSVHICRLVMGHTTHPRGNRREKHFAATSWRPTQTDSKGFSVLTQTDSQWRAARCPPFWAWNPKPWIRMRRNSSRSGTYLALAPSPQKHAICNAIPRHSMYAIFTYIGVVPGGSIDRHIC